MASRFYREGFSDTLAALTKTAKAYDEMTDAEKKRADKSFAAYEKARDEATPKQDPIRSRPTNLAEGFGNSLHGLKMTLGSLGHGAVSAAGATGLRLANGAFTLATWPFELADSLVLGPAGIGEGKGLTGGARGWVERKIDKGVDAMRRISSDYDYQHRIGPATSAINRFTSGAMADALGGFYGFGGMHGLAARGLSRVLPLGFGGLGAYSAISEGRMKQLRDREEMIRSVRPENRQYYDATATSYNRKYAPTKDEYQWHHLPGAIPGNWSGKLKIPYRWSHQSNGIPVQFKPYENEV